MTKRKHFSQLVTEKETSEEEKNICTAAPKRRLKYLETNYCFIQLV